MSARKWAYYSMPVGATCLVCNPPKRFATSVRRHAEEKGKRFSVRRWETENPALLVVMRIA